VSSKRRSRKAVPPTPTKRTGALLDAFTEYDLERWSSRSVDLQRYSDRVYFEMERERTQNHNKLCAALQSIPSIEVSIDKWVRVTDYRWSLTPLSPAGSIQGIGGRFNMGNELHRARDQQFPALYIGKTVETGMCEFFGSPLGSKSGRMSLHELALRRPTSFTTFSLRGRVEQVLDLRTHKHLKPFTDIVGNFRLSKETQRFGREHRLKPYFLVKTTSHLWNLVLAGSVVWRGEPNFLGIPAASQIFGRFVRDAGFEAVLYPSRQGGEECLAIYPQNFVSSNSRIEVVGGFPDGATCTVLDKNNICPDGIFPPSR
jgi:hypothetical protein